MKIFRELESYGTHVKYPEKGMENYTNGKYMLALSSINHPFLCGHKITVPLSWEQH